MGSSSSLRVYGQSRRIADLNSCTTIRKITVKQGSDVQFELFSDRLLLYREVLQIGVRSKYE